MKKVLIVDDQADIRELIRLTLEIQAFDIHEAEDGESGLALARELAPDLVLLDVMMPGPLDGLAVCDRIKSDPALRHMKVIILSARGRDDAPGPGLQAQADDYLTKPFSPRQLLAVVTRQLG